MGSRAENPSVHVASKRIFFLGRLSWSVLTVRSFSVSKKCYFLKRVLAEMSNYKGVLRKMALYFMFYIFCFYFL